MISRQTLPCFAAEANLDLSQESIIPLELVSVQNYESWLRQQDECTLNWLMANNFKIKEHSFCLLPDSNGKVVKVLVGVGETLNLWSIAHLPLDLPVGYYQLPESFDEVWPELALGWGLGAYQYDAYKTAERISATLVTSEDHAIEAVQAQLQAIYLVRDLVNTPAENMGPEELSFAAQALANHYAAEFSEIIGDELLKENYPAIHVVGRGSERQPRLLDLRWGDESHPKLTLVGKGVCFDTGGYDLKTAAGMLLMKKDMGGAAHVLGLASMIMDAKLPVRLRVLIPAVENSVSGRSYRPGDVIQTRKGLTVEIGNTDAEGRVVLSDALAEASSEKPDLIIDMATLTGAAKVGLGSEIPAMFSTDQENANAIAELSMDVHDLVWELPLHQNYRELLDSKIADISNNSSSPWGGSITAALFLQAFVGEDTPWLHFDLMAWNLIQRPGRPIGGDAHGLRAVFAFLQQRYK